MDDAIHVEVEAVELGDSVFGNELGDGRIALGEPSEELGNTHGDGVGVAVNEAGRRSVGGAMPGSDLQCEAAWWPVNGTAR